MEVSFLVITLVILTALSAFFAGSEISLFSLSSMTVKSYQRDPNPRKRLIFRLMEHPRELFVTVFMGNTAVNILLQNNASLLFGEDASWVLKVGVPLIIVLLLGEILPKYIALVNNVRVAYASAPLVDLFSKLFRPICDAVLKITVPVTRMMFFFLRSEPEVTRDEMQHALQTSQEYGVLHPDEVTLVSGYLDLQEHMVKEVMQPRGDILFYDIQKPLTKLIHLFVEEECSRIPVCDGDIQNILGIATATTFFLRRDEIESPKQLIPFLAKPFYVPETTPVRKLLRQFDERNEEVAIVVDEYGSVAGLITQEDLVEVVIGQIADRRDERSLYTRSGDSVIIASGKLDLDELEQIFGVRLFSPNNVVTLGGWLTEQLGDIPKSGTRYETPDFLFQVLAADPNRIRRIYVRHLPKGSP